MEDKSRAGAVIISLLALGISHAQAQDVIDETTDIAPSQDMTAEDPPRQTDGGPVVLDAISVTARRREENVQDVPVSVTAIPAEDLSPGRATALEDLGQVTPNAMAGFSNGAQFTIRGVGGMALTGLDRQQGVGVFMDDVYMSRTWSAPYMLSDLEGAEIVRGSQSLLYGKNTIGGSVNMRTRNPGHDYDGFAEVSGGRFSRWNASVGQDVSLNEDVAMRFFMTGGRDEGYVKNTTTGDDEIDMNSIAGRWTTLADLTDDTSLRFVLDATWLDDDGRVPFVEVPLAKDFKSDLDQRSARNLLQGGVTAKLEHAFDFGDLTSISSVRGYAYDLILDGDFSPASMFMQGQVENQYQMSQEVRLESRLKDKPEAGDLDWRVGLFYMYENFDGRQVYDMAGNSLESGGTNVMQLETDTYSTFGELTYHLTSDFEVHGGIRHSLETKTGSVAEYAPSGTLFFGNGMPRSSGEETVSFTNFSPEFGLSYQVAPELKVFGRVSRGFKSGGISQFFDADGTANNYDPETAWSYEIGAKSQFLDNRVTVNASAFRIDWTNQQAFIFVDNINRVISNAAKASNMGFELEAAAQVTDDLRFNVNFGYQDAKYEAFKDDITNADYSGDPLPMAPKFSVGGGVDFYRPLYDDVDLFAKADYSFRSDYSFDPSNPYREHPTHLVNSEIGIQIGDIRGSLWGRNLLNQSYIQESFRNFLVADEDLGVVAEPLSFGASLKVEW